jgi:acylpyruvate hydrolase
VTSDEAAGPHEITCEVNGETMQRAFTDDLVFTPTDLVSYVSSIVPLEPGDLLLTGTPGGVGFALTPPRFLNHGDEVVTRVAGIGECRNLCRRT